MKSARVNCSSDKSVPTTFELDFNDQGGVSTILVIQPCEVPMIKNTVTSAIVKVSPNFSSETLTYDVNSLKVVDILTLEK